MRPVIPVSKFSLPNFLRTVGLSRVFTLSSIRSTSCTLKVWGVQSFPEGTLSSQCFMLDLSLGIMWPLQWLEYKVLPMLVLHSLIKLTGVLPVTNPLLTIPKCLTDNDYFRDTEIFSWLFCEWWKTWCLTWNYTRDKLAGMRHPLLCLVSFINTNWDSVAQNRELRVPFLHGTNCLVLSFYTFPWHHRHCPPVGYLSRKHTLHLYL